MTTREGSLEAPTRHTLDWKNPEFYDQGLLFQELERVFDICHGCRRCFSLCNAFPTLFDAIDESDTGEVDGIEKSAYWDVVEHCYLCDMCYMTKCPYVPPHAWNVDFPHLMLRAKAVHHKQGKARRRDRILSSTDVVGRLAGIPVVAQTVNASMRTDFGRRMMEKTLGVHHKAPLPSYQSRSFRRQFRKHHKPDLEMIATEQTRGRVILFTTCYANRNEPQIAEDLVSVFEHNGIRVRTARRERCCGMPKLELGDLDAVEKAMEVNIAQLLAFADDGWDIVAPVPSCVLMFKQELPLMFPDREDVRKVKEAIFDPFEYLMLRHREGLLRTDFQRGLGKIAYQVPCHLRVQNIGLKTRDVLKLIPDTEVRAIERCSGHDGTYAVKSEFYETAMKIGRPVARQIKESDADYYSSDCPMAGHMIESGLDGTRAPTHPLTLLRLAYGI